MTKKKLSANKNAAKGKKKVWKKGHSSTYNPAIKKFRDEAKKRVRFGVQGTNSKLTETALALHNKDDHDITDDIDDCATSIGGLSFVSTFSNCNNPAFNRFLSRWHSNSAMHKEMLAVLAAVTEVIKAKGGNETETEYFAALMTTLEIVETNEARCAVFALLYMVVRKLPASVLKVNFSSACNVLQQQLLKHMDSNQNGLLKSILGCLFFFLKSQEVSSWYSSVTEAYTVLLEFTVHQKPKVRKSAQEAVRFLLSMTPEESEQVFVHPAAAMTGQFCVQKIESAAGTENNMTLHVLNLLKVIFEKLPRSSLKLCCETVLRVMTLSDPIVVTTCLRCLQGLFLNNTSPIENLPDVLNARIIKALYDYQPNINDCEAFKDWLLLMEYAFINLYRLNPALCLNHLPRFYAVAVSSWLSEQESLHPAVSATLKSLLQSCINPSSAEFQQLLLDDPIDNPMHKMFRSVEDALSYKYHKAWKQVLIVLATFFDVMSKHSYPVMLKCLQSLANLRDGFKFPHIAEVDNVIGNAIRRMGPETVLKTVPLKIDLESRTMDFSRSWLLPLLRENIKETEISYFVRYFLPLVAALKKKATDCEINKRPVEAKTYELVCTQIWSLLHGFCCCPTDLAQSWKHVAKILGTTLNQQPELRIIILGSLRILIRNSIDKEEDRNEISKFAKNFLPILFNLYTTESQNKSDIKIRLSAFDTIITYLEITDSELCKSFFQKAMEKLKEAADFSQQALLDLTKAMLPYLDEGDIGEIYEYCKPLLSSTQHTVQKKSYGVIQKLCFNISESCRAFVSNHLKDLESLLLSSLMKSSPPSKAMRLACLMYITSQLTAENKDFILAVVPEATLCVKESSVKARKAAFDLLFEVGNTLKRWNNGDGKAALREYLQILLAGFTGSPHMMSATLLAIGHVIFLFKDDLESDLIHLLIENLCLLLTSRSREVVTSALSFVKVLFSTVSTTDLAQHVEYLVTSIAGISEDNQRASRFKAKELLTRLVRKFGYEMIAKLAPEKFQKQLTSIRKLENHKKKMNKEDTMDYELETYPKKNKNSDLIDDILEDSDEEPSEARSGKQKSRTYIEEGVNDIVDLLDPSANRRILASKPGSSKATVEKSSDFEISSDGRLIITDKRDDRPGKLKKKSGVESAASSMQNKKRKLGEEDDDDEEIDEHKSKPVAKGIHRTLSKTPQFGASFKSKKAAGDVKRGKIDPYAYVPLDRQALNKRKKKKLEGQFKGLFNAAKKGARKGAAKKRFMKGRK